MNNFNFEKEKSPERFTSRIVLKFFRHAEQEPGNKEKSDFERRLTATGREQAIKKSKIQDIEQAVAFGSPRKRAQETAGFVMAGKQEEITGKESLEGLKEKLDKKIKVGSKIAVDERLDFPVGDWDSKYVQEVFSAFKKSEGLKFIVEQSDKLAEKLNDNENLTYSKAAAKISGIILKYLNIAPKWDVLVQDKEKKYSDTLERFLASHLGVTESFLAKIIDKTKDREERDEFIKALDNQGFDFTEGFDIKILNRKPGIPEIWIDYKKEKDGDIIFEFSKNINKELLEEVINEGR